MNEDCFFFILFYYNFCALNIKRCIDIFNKKKNKLIHFDFPIYDLKYKYNYHKNSYKLNLINEFHIYICAIRV